MASGIHCSIGTVSTATPLARAITKTGVKFLLIDSGLNPRKLTPRECARIQGFPETFNLTAASDPQLYKQFGNSVSVPVIRAIAAEIAKVLGRDKG